MQRYITSSGAVLPRNPDELAKRKSPRGAKKNNGSKEIGQKAKKSPTQRQPRARALKMARPCPPFLNKEVFVNRAPADPDGAPAPPTFVTPKTKASRARAMKVARPRGNDRTHLNEGYFGDFTFPGQGLSISQAQFDLYGGGTAETQQHILSFHQFEP
ncbi:hypothetical protein PIB30_069386 [Stylosanthes scabra]|uniref:Uncharacterized protein n=1 Tax=Stylosanthes scabra TaxID=79078 RepID=A0ABU6YKR0_9FABA|nr:hypothetical protein [Stylosanthes scabra]